MMEFLGYVSIGCVLGIFIVIGVTSLAHWRMR